MRPKGSKNVKKQEAMPIIGEEIEPAIIETVEQKAIVADVKPEVRREYWVTTKWKGVMDVLKCKNCGHCESGDDKKDQMILHVITHFPKSEQEKLFNKLVKEY